MEFKLPHLGENIESGDVINVLVSVGDRVEKQQPILELETDKAVVEVPSSVEGVVESIHVKAGDKASFGQLILTLSDGDAPAQTPEETGVPAGSTPGEDAKGAVKPASERREADAAASGETQRPTSEPGRSGEVVEFQKRAAKAVPDLPGETAAAAPSVRRLAREIGVDIQRVTGSGPQGRISQEDVKEFARRTLRTPTPGGSPDDPAFEPLPDFSRWGEVDRKSFSNVRRKTAQHMTQCWRTIPHVTQNDQCDITALEELRKRYAKRVDDKGGKLTVTAIILKVAASALRLFPQFNASIDTAAEEIVYKRYIHIGVAVDTPRGLLVPVVKNADRKNIADLSKELLGLAEKARSGKLALEDMQGGTFTITNLGGIGGTGFTPIVNWPEVAILGVSRSSMTPVLVDGQFAPRNLLPLSLSYDHRLIDGADAARFLRWVAEALENPFLLALEG